ncbi:MAG: hypothetical protein OFPII_42440 [Osedax symbiont Rs1]|nr:MAG: hypothetical protein OFPII_42440 [Osedax symbiont Rs1]
MNTKFQLCESDEMVLNRAFFMSLSITLIEINSSHLDIYSIKIIF